jgi:TorA maturation chaperone TorD
MEHAGHEKGVAEFHLIDHLAIELEILAALEDEIPDRRGAEIEFLEKLVHVTPHSSEQAG